MSRLMACEDGEPLPRVMSAAVIGSSEEATQPLVRFSSALPGAGNPFRIQAAPRHPLLGAGSAVTLFAVTQAGPTRIPSLGLRVISTGTLHVEDVSALTVVTVTEPKLPPRADQHTFHQPSASDVTTPVKPPLPLAIRRAGIHTRTL
jgi:hypothetical protein